MFQDLLNFSKLFCDDVGVTVLSNGFENWVETGTCFPEDPPFPLFPVRANENENDSVEESHV